jgi:hypothetical protein
MNKNQQAIYQILTDYIKTWPPILQKGIKKTWQNTKQDDIKGLISLLPLSVLKDCQLSAKPKAINQAQQLGVAALLLWMAANLQDDITDERDAPKYYVPLANTCLLHAWYILQSLTNPKKQQSILDILTTTDAANYQALLFPLKTPKKNLDIGNKAQFLLAPIFVLLNYLQINNLEIQKFMKSAKYFLAAKQLADDVYDYQEDWQMGRRTSAHQKLRSLPTAKNINNYYQKQSRRIIFLCNQCRQELKTVTFLEKNDCFEKHLQTLEYNCYRAMAK